MERLRSRGLERDDRPGRGALDASDLDLDLGRGDDGEAVPRILAEPGQPGVRGKRPANLLKDRDVRLECGHRVEHLRARGAAAVPRGESNGPVSSGSRNCRTFGDTRMIWLGDRRGSLTDWTTQRWVALTGRTVAFEDVPWLRGPIGSTRGIGPDYFQDLAAGEGLVVRETGQRGLMQRFADLGGPRFDPSVVPQEVATFYERTSAYSMDVWSEWCGAFRPLGRLLAVLFSRRLRQLNLPLSSLDASLGVTSRVFTLCDPLTERVVHTGWLRSLSGSGRVLYAAIYSLERVPGHDGPCVKVVFPLPNGNAIVFLRPEVGPEGELVLLSEGRGFGA